jgi:hypothetical protein
MDALQSGILPRLVLDTINCLWIAHDSAHHNVQRQTRQAIAFLEKADVTDADRTAFMLLEIEHHLREIESRLETLDRPFIVKKIRGIRHRVCHLAAYQRFWSVH